MRELFPGPPLRALASLGLTAAAPPPVRYAATLSDESLRRGHNLVINIMSLPRRAVLMTDGRSRSGRGRLT